MKKVVFLIWVFFLGLFELSSQEKEKNLYDYIGAYHQATSVEEYAEPLSFFERDKDLSLSEDNFKMAAFNSYYIAKIALKFGDLIKSEESAVEGLELLDQLQMNDTIAKYKVSLYNHLGILNRTKGNYATALEDYHKSLQFINEEWDQALAYNNIGVTHLYMDNYEMAKENFQKSNRLFQKLQDTAKIALSLANLGRVKAKLREPDALDHLLEALALWEEIQSPKIFENYNFLTEYYTDKKDTLKALSYAQKGYESAKKFNSLEYKYEALTQLAKLGDYSNANEYNEVFGELLRMKNLKDATYAEAKYNVSQEKQNTERERRKRSRQQLIYLGLVAIAIIGFAFFVVYLINRFKKDSLKKQFETEQQISKKLHDEVANEVFYVMTKVQSNFVNQDELVDHLDEIYHKTRDISKVYAEIDVSSNFNTLLNDLISSFKTQGVNIFTKNSSQISWNSISETKRKVLYKVLQELMTNMRKHSRASLVTLSFEKERNQIKIVYVDNGVGCVINKGIGLSSTENRMELIGGSIIFESEINKGFRANLIL